jgi:hypothetical protein
MSKLPKEQRTFLRELKRRMKQPEEQPKIDPRLYDLKPELDKLTEWVNSPEGQEKARTMGRKLSRVSVEDMFRPFDI